MTDSNGNGNGGGRTTRIVRETPGSGNGVTGGGGGGNNVTAPPPAAEPTIVAMRNGTQMAVSNGNGTGNGGTRNGNDPNAAIQRGMEVLAEQELDQNLEEIRKLDTQLDHFNQYLDTFEKRNSELTDRLTKLIKSQREDRLKRRASFVQREEEYKAEQNSFDNQLHGMLSRCAQSRRTSVPVFGASVERMIDQQQNRGQQNQNQNPQNRHQ